MWYERARQLYPLGFMTLEQLIIIYNKGWITQAEFEEIKKLN